MALILSGGGAGSELISYDIVVANVGTGVYTISFNYDNVTACTMTVSNGGSNSTSGTFTHNGISHSVSMSGRESAGARLQSLTIDSEIVFSSIDALYGAGTHTQNWRL